MTTVGSQSETVNVIGQQQQQQPGVVIGRGTQQQGVVGGIEFAASAKEARQRMKKKADAKQQATNLSLRDKYQLLQNLWQLLQNLWDTHRQTDIDRHGETDIDRHRDIHRHLISSQTCHCAINTNCYRTFETDIERHRHTETNISSETCHRHRDIDR